MPATDAARAFDRSMRRWADVAEVVRATRKTSEKVASVADYLRSLDSADLGTAVVFLSGRPFPERDLRTTGLGWSAIAAAALAVAGAGPDALSAAYERSSDLGTSVGELLATAGAYRLTRPDAARIVRKTSEQVREREAVAIELGLPVGERRRMARAFDADRISRALTIE